MGTDRRGSTALGLIEAANTSGFAAKGVRGSKKDLGAVPLPAIAHLVVGGDLEHYVVLVEWTPKSCKIMDPGIGRVRSWKSADFEKAWSGVLILLAPGKTFRGGAHAVPAWLRLKQLLEPHQAVMMQVLCAAVVMTVLGLGMPVYIQKVIDQAIPNSNRQMLNLLSVGVLAILVGKLLLGWMQSILSYRLAQKIDVSLIMAYYRHLLSLPQAFFDTMRIGEITSRLADAVKIRTFLNQTLLSLLLSPLMLIFSLGGMMLYSWQLAWLSGLFLLGNIILYLLSSWINRPYQRTLMTQSADMAAQVVESLNTIDIVRKLQLTESTTLKTEARLVRVLKTGWRFATASLALGTISGVLVHAYMVGMVWTGVLLVFDAEITPGQLIACYTLAAYITGPVTTIIGLNASVQEALIATDRLFEIMDLEVEKDQGTIELEEVGEVGIRFDGVVFKHAGRAATLQGVSLHIPAGKITVLMGESGCGKSTLLALIQRLYLPQEGRVFVGEHDINYYRLASLRSRLAVVPQQTRLLSGTILENIAPGDYQPDMRRVLRLCGEIGILEFIEKLPQGFFTQLSEDGLGLSGGQRQRLALVRALYLDAPILLLDEPSSALDVDSAMRLMEVLKRLRSEGRTIVLATHASWIAGLADQSVLMTDGKIASVHRKPLDAEGVDTAGVAPASRSGHLMVLDAASADGPVSDAEPTR